MKRIAILAAFALLTGMGATVACEDGTYAMDEPVVTVPQRVADCGGRNCATDEPVVTVPQIATPCSGSDCARPEPAPTHAQRARAGMGMRAEPCTGNDCAIPEPGEQPSPGRPQVAGPCGDNNC